MSDSSNPFAAFAFAGAKRPREPDFSSASGPRCKAREPRAALEARDTAPAVQAGCLAGAEAALAAVPGETAAAPAPTPAPQREAPASSLDSSAKKLAEFALIASYRETTGASVDEFHRFLLSLGTGGEPALGDPRHGRFWALVACLLSVQCRDHVALAATRDLIRVCDGEGAAGVAALPDDELDALVRKCNFYKTKAQNVRAAAVHAAMHGGRVPTSYEDLLKLKGVGPKIAHLMRSVAYGQPHAGLVVDTHLCRVASRLGWVDTTAATSGPEATRTQLEAWVPYDDRVRFSLAVVGFGQLARSGGGWERAFVDHVAAQHVPKPSAQPSAKPEVRDDDGAVALAESIVVRMRK